MSKSGMNNPARGWAVRGEERMDDNDAPQARYAPGDQLCSRCGVVCEIVDVRPTGYGWRYHDLPDPTPEGRENYFWSENSTDPFFNGLAGWRLLNADERVEEMLEDRQAAMRD